MENFLLYKLIFLILTIGFVLGSALIIIYYWFRMSNKQPGQDTRIEEQKIILPLRLQAYERIILFLERISPNNLVMRLSKPEMTSVQFQSLLVKTVREEFDYNLSQQIYISFTAWELVKNAKEETIKLINVASGRVPESGSSGELAKTIFDLAFEKDKLPVNIAIDEIKKEIQKIL